MAALPSNIYTQPSNLTFHNLCTNQQLPTGSRQILGLNLSFCLTPRTFHENIRQTMLKLAYSIRTKHYLKTTDNARDSNYIPQIYLKNKSWNPPPASTVIEHQLTVFEKALRKQCDTLTKKYHNYNLSNLTPIQSNALKKLRSNDAIIIKPTDKNLGPAVMDKETYKSKIISEHLSTAVYSKLTQQEALSRLAQLKDTLKDMVSNHQDSLSPPELTYFHRGLRNQHRIPLFYGLPKVHKIPVSLRPVVSTTNSLLAIFSNWLDFRMKELLPLVQSYTKNSTDIIHDLKGLTLPENAKLFSADATSMYTNIDTTLGLDTMKEFLSANSTNISPTFPTHLFLQIMEVVMRNNIFAFQDTYWLQTSGTAMGTPVACAYATVTYGHYENSTILTNFKTNLLYYRRYIDDVFGIWIPLSTENNTERWEQFKNQLNSWGNLKWVIEDPTLSTNFLDLTLTISESKVITKTFQKDMNLYLYIPASSAHPPSCLKGLITGEMRRYWIQNNLRDFEEILSKFIQRLHERGHNIQNLIPILRNAAASLDSPTTKNGRNNDDNTLYLHWPYHPHGIQRMKLRQLYNEHLAHVLDYDNMVVAMSRPVNLKDLLTKAALAPESPNSNLRLVTRH